MKLNLTDMHPLLDRETEDIPVVLVTLIYKSGGSSTELYFCTDNADEFEIEGRKARGVVSRGRRYLYCPMQITLPTDNEGGNAQISIDNASRHATQAVREAQAEDGMPQIKFEIVLLSTDIAESRDIIAADFPPLNIISVKTDPFTITAEIAANSLEGESFPGRIYSPSYFPGIFGRG
jgi:hypothetical protein